MESIHAYTLDVQNAPESLAMITSCNVMPLRKYAEISYRVKCVMVENERVFGDVYVTHQTRDPICQSEDYALLSEYKRRKRNLIQKTLDGPDFMKLNSKRSTRTVAKLYWQRRSKSLGDEPSLIPFNCENARNRVTKRPKVNIRTMRFEIDRSSHQEVNLRYKRI